VCLISMCLHLSCCVPAPVFYHPALLLLLVFTLRPASAGFAVCFMPICFLEMCSGSGLGLSAAGVVAVGLQLLFSCIILRGSRVSVSYSAYLCFVCGFVLLILF
jgi:hypothetical protein